MFLTKVLLFRQLWGILLSWDKAHTTHNSMKSFYYDVRVCKLKVKCLKKRGSEYNRNVKHLSPSVAWVHHLKQFKHRRFESMCTGVFNRCYRSNCVNNTADNQFVLCWPNVTWTQILNIFLKTHIVVLFSETKHQ